MQFDFFIKQSLTLHGVPVIQSDLPFILDVYRTILQEHNTLNVAQNIHEEVPIVVVDQDVIIYD